MRRELPNILHIELIEHEPAALVSLESIYLCDSDGVVFSASPPQRVWRAGRDHRHRSRRLCLSRPMPAPRFAPRSSPWGAISTSRVGPNWRDPHRSLRRPDAVHPGRHGAAARPGHPDELDARLARFDTLWRKISRGEPLPQMVYLNNRAHPDHLTVRYPGAAAQ